MCAYAYEYVYLCVYIYAIKKNEKNLQKKSGL